MRTENTDSAKPGTDGTPGGMDHEHLETAIHDLSLAQAINGAEDRFGVLPSSAIQSQLNSFTASDWKDAATVFDRHDASANKGFWIDDTDGTVTIHNDLSQAKTEASQSVLSGALEGLKSDAKGLAGLAAGLTFGVGGLGTVEAGLLGGTAAEAISTGAVFGIIGLGVTILAGGAIVTGELMDSASIHGQAQDDLANNGQYSFKPQVSP